MASVFEKVNMKLCNLPHPAGYTYAPTHIGVDYSPTPVLGARVWASFSPYPGFNDDYENPCVAWANNYVDFPTNFTAYAGNPIFPKADTGDPTDASFNADPDILIDNSILYVTNRPWYRTGGGTETMRNDLFIGQGTSSLTGFSALQTLYQGTTEFASPAIVHFLNKFRIYDLISWAWNSASGKCYDLRIWEGNSLAAGSLSYIKKGSILGYKIEPWHFSVFNHNGKLYSIVSAKKQWFTGAESGNIYLGEFDEAGENLFIHSRPLVDFICYRSDAYVNENGLFVLYASYFDNDRQIYASAIDFEKLLKMLRV